ncbi:1-acyl-sn-glycerol-3-phosphate acyltransferase [Ancylothrix sp. C2]|uniref:lysophospholipid acyltransferase family protein n=1 Tax=Ancylothrix sp. D3o TaxID=2953691 RepID=UPI0021BA5C59|nr:1-acyl-sn-glycerol-3-phosphate acyltransferase [Ancylothrix sp. D3o]MCT7949944.1 1-acyl-sn-glycerol-3-phosphate acyltransferase [Ancylothrix sp. D3o]
MLQLNSEEKSAIQPTANKPAPVSQISPWLMAIAYPLMRFFVLPLYLGRIEVTGQENMPKDGPVILAPTHRARWDAFMVPYVSGRHITGRDLRFMVTSDEVTGIQGWFIRRLGGFAVNIKHPAISSLRHGVELLLNRCMMVIFPEGGVFRDNELHPLKAGLARIAIQAETNSPGLGVQIVPISIRYGDPSVKWLSGVKIHIGKPLKVADYCQSHSKQNAQKLTNDLQKSLEELDILNVF